MRISISQEYCFEFALVVFHATDRCSLVPLRFAALETDTTARRDQDSRTIHGWLSF